MCSCRREYEREKAGTYMQRVVDADMASLAERRRELGVSSVMGLPWTPAGGLLIESSSTQATMSKTVVRMLVQAEHSHVTRSQRADEERVPKDSRQADAMVYSFLLVVTRSEAIKRPASTIGNALNPRGRYALLNSLPY